MNKQCYILVGPPASGKSTYADYSSEIPPLIVSSDDVIESICEMFNVTYDEIFEHTIGLAEMLFWRDLEHFAKIGSSLTIDRTNMSIKSRKRIINMFKPYGYEFHAVVFPAPEKAEWDMRLNSRPGKTIPPHVIESMLKNFQMPTLEEGFTTVTVYEEATA